MVSAAARQEDSDKGTVGLGERDPRNVAGRYEITGVLGRGGMAVAYRARDAQTGALVALKRLAASGEPERGARMVELFEREFHTLTQLAHPRVVQAFDYGVDGGCPYYTMEILDGGDLRALAPLPYQEACLVAYEVCSALSLLHSRRLVHRDLTPRNVRRTADGKAKLIDFGLLAPMGPNTAVAGTAPYLAPEALQSMSLDGRSDLFSLGATLYHALTGRTAFPVRRFDQLVNAWRASPPAPSKLVAGIPAAVDALVLSLLRIDAASRPKTAAEVMDRLKPLLAEPPQEELAVAGAYLAAPKMVGRDAELIRVRKRVLKTMRRRGGGFVVSGVGGSGRSRMLDAFVLEAKLIGACTLRAGATEAAAGVFGVAQALAEQLYAALPQLSLEVMGMHPAAHEVLFGRLPGPCVLASSATMPKPRLLPLSRSGLDPEQVQGALRTWLLEIADRRPLAIAVDDFEQVDEASAALLAATFVQGTKHRLAYAVTLDSAASSEANAALSPLRMIAEQLELRALSEGHIGALLESVFGDVANLQCLVDRLYALCGGRPRECMSLAQHLVDTGVITYASGSWRIPKALGADVLPEHMESALGARLAALSPWARRIGLLISLGLVERLSRPVLVALEGAVPADIDSALSELLSAQVIAGGDAGYAVRNRDVARLLIAAAGAHELAARHDELAASYEAFGQPTIATAYHALQGSFPERGVEMLVAQLGDTEARNVFIARAGGSLPERSIAVTLELALAEANRRKRPRRELQSLWVMVGAMATRGQDARYFYDLPPAWLQQLKRDSGFNDWHALDAELDPTARAMQAVRLAAARFRATPEADRVLDPTSAIKQFVAYVLFGIAVGVRTSDLALLARLPALMEPFAPLDPALKTILDNARATLENNLGRREAAREKFVQLIAALATFSSEELAAATGIRHSMRQTVFEIDASLGVQPRDVDESLGERDPAQRVGAEYIRKVAALHRGDWEAAEGHRQQAELIALRSRSGAMFSTLGQELEAHALARDLTGLKPVRDGIAAMAERHRGWTPLAHVANAYHFYLCGEPGQALDEVAVLRQSQRGAELRSPWVIPAIALRTEIMVERGDPEGALSDALEALVWCAWEDMRHFRRLLACSTARCEAALGHFDQAYARLETVLAEQRALGVTGLLLGRTHEYVARVAIAAGDRETFDRQLALVAEHYRPGESSVLGALHARLIEHARSASVIEEVSSAIYAVATSESGSSCWSHVSTAMSNCQSQSERAQRALALLCNDREPRRGHLFLLTDTGLTHCASNVACENRSALAAFAQEAIDQELDDGMCTQTAAGVQEPQAGTSAFWEPGDGQRYAPIVLTATGGAQRQVVGVVLLTAASSEGSDPAHEVASALTRMLIASGDYRPVATI